MIGILRIKDAEGNWQEIEAIRGPKGDKGDTGEQGPKGADGTMKFEDLTEEQRATLKGDKGDIGPVGPKGDAYVITDEDKIEIGNMVIAGLPHAEEGEF